MNHSLIITLAALAAGCPKNGPIGSIPSTADEAPATLAVSMSLSPLINDRVAQEHPYALTLSIEGTDDRYTFITDMDLFGGSFFVSPLATGDFKGKFQLEIAPNPDLELGTDIVATPRAKEVIDLHPFLGEPETWVKEDTRYAYPLILHTEQDFDIGGKIMFTIEPKCTLEEVPMLFRYRSGVLTVEKWEC